VANYNEPWNKGKTKEQCPQLAGQGRKKGCVAWNKGIHQWAGKVHPTLGKKFTSVSEAKKKYWEIHRVEHSVTSTCKFCGMLFEHLKSKVREYCSKSCAASNHTFESRKRVATKAKETCIQKGVYLRQSERMKNGGALKALRGNLSPSMPQLKLFFIMRHIFSDAMLEYEVVGRSLDVAIPSLKLDLEYDGKYWHEDRPNAKEIDHKRDQELSALGWKIIRLNKGSFGGVLCH